ncbi:MAG TPA: trypsin-like peptidase domain-containing protein [Flavobacteriales bacterium]
MEQRIPLHLLLIAGLLAAAPSSAQIAFEGTPWARHAKKMGLSEVPVYKRNALDRQALLAEDEQRAADGNKRLRFGVNHATDLTLDNSGVWDVLPNGDRVWRLSIELKEAFSINFEFNTFEVPEGGKVFVYTPSGETLGAFTAQSNPGHTELGVGLLPGDRITVEYDEPAAVAGQGRLRIGQVTQGYRDSFAARKGFNESLGCNNNVICPEGDPWNAQIRSVARIVVNGGDWCTGQLINNCSNDGTPYFLTANHCVSGSVSNWVFAFNWESSTCATNTNTPMNQTVSGATLLENSGGSDVALLRLNSTPPSGYNVYYSGWDASGAAPLDQVGIHHPSGDQKKISFNGETSASTNYGGAQTWQVDAWDDGTTEGGSSGSGLWDQNGRLVGQLFGGTFGCNCTDYYGKFSVSHPLLDEWLGSCADILDGHDPNAASFAVDGAIQGINNIPENGCNVSSVQPEVVIRNAGTSTLTSLTLSWQLVGGASGTENWTGSLASGATATVTMPTVTVANGLNTYTVTSGLPNGVADMNNVNDMRDVEFSIANPGAQVAFNLTLDDYGSETSWQVTTQVGGAVVGSGGGYPDDADGQLFIEDLCLAEGCYVLTIFDTAEDGLCCDYGTGSYTVTSGGQTLVTGNGVFSDEVSHTFCVENSVGLVDLNGGALAVWPNPGTGEFNVTLPHGSAGVVNYEVIDATGRLVHAAQRSVQPGAAVLDLGGLNNGIYTLKATVDGSVLIQRLVVRR